MGAREAWWDDQALEQSVQRKAEMAVIPKIPMGGHRAWCVTLLFRNT